MSYVHVNAFSPAAEDNTTKKLHWVECVSASVCVCTFFQNDDRITTHSELCSGE